MAERRRALGGPIPSRTVSHQPLPAPAERPFQSLEKGSKQPVATTMAFVRLVKDLMKEPETGRRWVPIVPDEARTFGMESLFPAKIYSPLGQRYESVDRDLLLSYQEAVDGQLLIEGIAEAGSMASSRPPPPATPPTARP